jgi:hypothetical protein
MPWRKRVTDRNQLAVVKPADRSRPCRSFHLAASSAMMDMPGNARAVMNDGADDPDCHTDDRVRPSQPRITVTTHACRSGSSRSANRGGALSRWRASRNPKVAGTDGRPVARLSGLDGTMSLCRCSTPQRLQVFTAAGEPDTLFDEIFAPRVTNYCRRTSRCGAIRCIAMYAAAQELA